MVTPDIIITMICVFVPAILFMIAVAFADEEEKFQPIIEREKDRFASGQLNEREFLARIEYLIKNDLENELFIVYPRAIQKEFDNPFELERIRF